MKRNRSTKTTQWVTLFFLILIFLCFFGYFLCTRIMEYYSQMDPILQRIKQTLYPLDPIVKQIHFYEGNKSYTINKSKIYLCLKDEHHQYYDFNMLIYVAIHELAHVLCDEIGHTEKFHRIFRSLLERAHDLHIYDPSKPIVKNYCGHK